MSRDEPTIAELRERYAREEAQNRALLVAVFDSGDYWGAAQVALPPGLSEEVPRLLWQRWSAGSLAREQLREAVPPIWIFNRSPVSPIGEHAWLTMFRAAGYLCQTAHSRVHLSDGTLTEVEAAYRVELAETPPKDSLVVWRGASLESHGRGFSWTYYRECGEGFAQGCANTYQRASGLYRAEIPGRAVLAIFGDDREQEVVVNPNMLRGRTELVSVIEPEPLSELPFYSSELDGVLRRMALMAGSEGGRADGSLAGRTLSG
jgi:hypothetical protein